MSSPSPESTPPPGIQALIARADRLLERAALRWALRRGSRSGRTAWQFARDWAGRTP